MMAIGKLQWISSQQPLDVSNLSSGDLTEQATARA